MRQPTRVGDLTCPRLSQGLIRMYEISEPCRCRKALASSVKLKDPTPRAVASW